MRATAMFRGLLQTVAATAMMILCSAANASVIYEFEGTSGNPVVNAGGFTYTASDFVIGTVTPPLWSLDECHVSMPTDGQCYRVSLMPDFMDGYDTIAFAFTSNLAQLFYFADGALSTPGVYGPAIQIINLGTLVVRDTTSSSVPEPGTFALLLFGLALLAIARRGRPAL